MLAVFCLPAPAATLTVNPSYTVTDFGLTTNAVRRVTLTPISPGGDYTNAFLAPRPIASATYTNGVAAFTNIVSGYAYALSLETVFSTTRRTNYFPATLSGDINGGDYLAWLAGFATDGRVLQWAWLNITNLSTGLSLTNGNLYNVTNTGAITFNGQVLTNGWRDVTNFFTQTGGSGSGINVAAGSRVTATTNGGNTLVTVSADAQTNATLGALAITGAITNVVAGSNATVQIANGIATVNAIPDGGGAVAGSASVGVSTNGSVFTPFVTGSLTNRAQNYTFTNLSEMVASPMTNGTVSVRGYWGTNEIGGGDFRHSTNAATTNLGTIFLSAYGGYWHRTRPEGSNVWRLDWFGVTPMNSNDPTTRRDSYREITNAVAVAGDFSTLYLPPFGIFTSRDLIFTNWTGRKLVGSGSSFATKNNYPEKSSWLAYEGPGGSESVLLRLWNPYNCTIDNICFDTSTPVFSSGGYYVTNNAQIALDIDQFVGGGQIATANKILNNTFRSRGTNVVWQGLRISATSEQNCENFLLENNYFRSVNVDITATGNSGYAVLIGRSPNSRAHIFRNTTWVGTQIGLVCSNGGFSFNGGLGDSTSFDFKLNSWAAPIEIKDFFTESGIQCFWLGSGADGGGGRTFPVVIDGYHNSHAQSQSNRPLFELHGSANVVVKNSAFYNETYPLQRVFTNDPGYSSALVSDNTQYGINYSKDDWRLGVTNFGSANFLNGNDANGGTPFSFRRNSWAFEIVDPNGQTNRELFRVNGAALQLSRTNSRVQIGNVPGSIATANLAVAANTTQVQVDIGDTEIVSRMKLGGTSGSTLLELHSTNSAQPVGLLLRSDSGPDLLRIDVTPTAADVRFGGTGFAVSSSASGGSGGQTALQISEATAITLTSTNNSITHNSTNNVFNGTGRFASNIVAGLGVVVSNATASSIAIFDAAKNLTNGYIGTGLAFDGVTLSATGGGSGVAWNDVTSKPHVVTNGATFDVVLSNSVFTARGDVRVGVDLFVTNDLAVTGDTTLYTVSSATGTYAIDEGGAARFDDTLYVGDAVYLTNLSASQFVATDANKKLVSTLNGSSLTGDDEAYDATGWNGDTTLPTKNAVRDKMELLAPLISPSFTTPALGVASGTSLTLSSLTSGRVPFATTAGLLTDDSALRWNNTTKAIELGVADTTAGRLDMFGDNDGNSSGVIAMLADSPSGEDRMVFTNAGAQAGFMFSGGPIHTEGITNVGLTASQFVVADANKKMVSTLNGSSLTNLMFPYTASTLINTQLALSANANLSVIITNNCHVTNWPALAVNGNWFNVTFTNSTSTDYRLYIPTNMATANLTNTFGAFVDLDGFGGTNWSVILSNRQRFKLAGDFSGNTVSSGMASGRQW